MLAKHISIGRLSTPSNRSICSLESVVIEEHLLVSLSSSCYYFIFPYVSNVKKDEMVSEKQDDGWFTR